MKCTAGTAQIPITMIRRMPMNSIELERAGGTPRALMTGASEIRLAISSAMMNAPMSRFSLVSTRRTLLERAKVSGYGLDMWFSPSHCWKHECDILRNDKHLIVVQYILRGPPAGLCHGDLFIVTHGTLSAIR